MEPTTTHALTHARTQYKLRSTVMGLDVDWEQVGEQDPNKGYAIQCDSASYTFLIWPQLMRFREGGHIDAVFAPPLSLDFPRLTCSLTAAAARKSRAPDREPTTRAIWRAEHQTPGIQP
jgi:hypothetical protein